MTHYSYFVQSSRNDSDETIKKLLLLKLLNQNNKLWCWNIVNNYHQTLVRCLLSSGGIIKHLFLIGISISGVKNLIIYSKNSVLVFIDGY